jgi:hypothetical protein
MRTASKRTALALDALNLVLDTLGRLPHSDDRQRLEGQARACERVVSCWQYYPPTDEDREDLMRRLLDLHMATAQLRRGSEPPP